MIRATLQAEPINIGAIIAGAQADGAGAVATFSGIVRGDDGVTALELEHYPAMTEAVMQSLAQEAAARWSLLSVRVVHRIGRMTPGETVVLVVTVAPHRHEALEACAFLIDLLKSETPFWKREWRGDAGAWVEPRQSDDRALARWREHPAED